MVVLRTIGAIILAMALGMVLGGIKEYLKLWPAENYEYVWPFAMGVSGAAGAIIMALMRPVKVVKGTAAVPAKSAIKLPGNVADKKTEAKAPVASTPQAAATQQSANVEGMPSFDFDAARSEIDQPGSAPGSRPTPEKPA